MTSALRDEFEKWCFDVSLSTAHGGTCVDGYKHQRTRDAWAGWQASRADLTQLVRDYALCVEALEQALVFVENTGYEDSKTWKDVNRALESAKAHTELFKAVGE